MRKLTLPFWLDGPHLEQLRKAAQIWWAKVESWLAWPLLQLDAETCHPTLLELLAWQRDITRYAREPEALFRRRVRYAYANARDAGSVAGVKRIFQRLEIGELKLHERVPGRDWDIVQIELSDEQYARFTDLLQIIVQMYGRTCRRYEVAVGNLITLHLGAIEVGHDQQTLVCEFGAISTTSLHLGATELSHDQVHLIARL